MPSVAAAEIARMRESVFFEGPELGRRLSRFWILLVLAAIIAAAGVVGDSTATVIGAMIVAPLMLPIQATMLSVVLADRVNLMRSLALVVAGASTAILIGWLMGFVVVGDVVAATNSQVAARVSPRLIDLLAALATGVVGSVALARRDISDTLPGVAIAISLVPPLSVVGLTLNAGEYSQAGGAMLLFLTNVAAILLTGTVVMAIYGVHRLTAPDVPSAIKAVDRRKAIVVIVAMLVLVGVPLTTASMRIARETTRESTVREVAQRWSAETGWQLVRVSLTNGKLTARFEGPLPVPSVDVLREAVAARGVDLDSVRIELVPLATIELGAPLP